MEMISDEELVALAERNSSFSKTSLGVQIGWDATSLELVKTCPYKYYLSMIQGYRAKKGNVDLFFGLIVHSSLELYHHKRAEGLTYEEAVREVLKFALIKTGKHVNEVYLKCSACDREWTETADRIPEICSNCKSTNSFFAVQDKATVWYPWESDDKNKTRYTLIRSLVWYLEQFKSDPAETVILENGKPAVELSFRMEIPLINPDGDPYLLSGHLDRLVRFGGSIFVTDVKSTKTTLNSDWFKKYMMDNQMSMYSTASKVVLKERAVGIILDAIQVAVTFTRCLRGFVKRTPGQLDEWLEDTMFWIKQAEGFAARRHWPMNDTSCNKYGKCVFRDNVCSKDPSVRPKFLDTHFRKETWDPLKSR